MRRREFVLGTVGALLSPRLVTADSRSSVPKIGFLFPGPESALKSRTPLLLEGLSSEGFHEPDQVILVTRATGGDEARIVPQLKELISEGVAILIPTGPSLMRAARSLTRSIPIVTFDLEGNVHHFSDRHRFHMRLRRLAKWGRTIRSIAAIATNRIPADVNQMKKSTPRVEQQSQPRNIQRADIAPAVGYALVVDGHFKTQFAEETIARKGAVELLAKYPMLKIEIYDASSKARTLVK